MVTTDKHPVDKTRERNIKKIKSPDTQSAMSNSFSLPETLKNNDMNSDHPFVQISSEGIF